IPEANHSSWVAGRAHVPSVVERARQSVSRRYATSGWESFDAKSPTVGMTVRLGQLRRPRVAYKHHTALILQSLASISSYSLLTAALSVTPRNWIMYPWRPGRITNGYIPAGFPPPIALLDTLGAYYLDIIPLKGPTHLNSLACP